MSHSIVSKIGSIAFLAFFPMITSAATASGGCNDSSYQYTSGTHTKSLGDQGRTFRIHVPPSYQPTLPTPVVFIFHGWGGNENSFLGNRQVRSEANKRGYILVAPRGLGSGAPDNSNNAWTFSGSDTGLDGDGGGICDPVITPDYRYPSCIDKHIAANTCSWTHCQTDDVAFTVALVEEIENHLCVDTDNIFATGGSNGGMFTWELGQNPDSAWIFRAIAPLIG